MSLSTEINEMRWNVSTLKEENKNNTLDFDVPIQRGYVWNHKKNSELIHSLLIGIPISDFIFNKVGNKYEGLEGKQRTKAICDFVDGIYKLHASLEPVKMRDGSFFDIAKRQFDDLPKELQEKILSYSLRIYWANNMTDDDKILIFSRINSGVPVTKADIARIKVPSRKAFAKLRDHQALAANVRPAALKKYADEDIIQDIYILSYVDNPCLLTASRTTTLASIEVTDVQKEELTNALDYMLAFYQTIKTDKRLYSKLRAKTHITMLGYMAVIALRNDISQEVFIEKAKAFYNGEGRVVTISNAYNMAASSGSARTENVCIRMNEVTAALGV